MKTWHKPLTTPAEPTAVCSVCEISIELRLGIDTMLLLMINILCHITYLGSFHLAFLVTLSALADNVILLEFDTHPL